MALQKRIGRLTVHKGLVALLLASFSNGIVWSGLIPIWQMPDEQAHFAQAQNLVVGRTASGTADPDTGPTTSEDIAKAEEYLGTFRQNGENIFTYHPENRIEYTNFVYGKYEAEIENLPLEYRRKFVINEATGYPPLYYKYIALINRVFWKGGLITRVYISRIATAAMTAAAVFISYLLAREIFKNEFYALITAGLVSDQPMWKFVGSGVTSDALFNLVYPLLIYCVIKLVKGDKKYFGWVLLTFILGLVTKLQIILLLPIVILICLRIAFKKGDNERLIRVISKAVLSLFFIIALITAGNYLNPDFTFYWMGKLGLKWLGSLLFLPELSNFGDKIGFISYWKTMGRELYIQSFPWYWGVYRWLSLTLPLWVYRVVKIVVLISGFGWVLAGIKRIKGKSGTRDISGIADIKGLSVILASIVTYGAGLLTWNYFFWRSHGYSFGIQGRYFFPNLPEHIILLLTGFLLLPLRNKFKKIIATVLVLGMMIFNWYSLYFVSASYYDISSWGRFFLQASQYKPWFFKTPILPMLVIFGILLGGWFLWSLMRYNVKSNK